MLRLRFRIKGQGWSNKKGYDLKHSEHLPEVKALRHIVSLVPP